MARHRVDPDAARTGKPVVEVPHDPLNEQIVIGAALASDKTRAKLVSRIRPDHFYGDGHPQLWAAVMEMQRRGLKYSAATVAQLSNGTVSATYVQQIEAAYPSVPPNLLHHVTALQWDVTRVTAVRGPISTLLKALKDPATPPDKLRALARQVSTSFDSVGDRRHLRDPVALADEMVRALRDRRTASQAVFPYGLDGFDWDVDEGKYRVVPGADPGGVTVVTGVPGSGKSTLVARVALAQYRMKRRVLFGAWEVTSPVTLELLAGMDLGYSRYDLSVPDNLSEDQVEALHQRAIEIGEYVLFVEMPFGRVQGEKQSNDRNLDIIHQYIADTGADVGIFDLWKRTLRYTEPDDEEQALVRQQAIAQETKCHCILVQQQRSKDIEMRPDKRPTREGIKGSGAWTEVPDTIIGVHRPALWKNVPDDELEGLLLKQRRGKWPLAVSFQWDPVYGTIVGGRTVDYDPPGSMRAHVMDDDLLQAPKGKGRR